jgi:hypothetical protein
MTESLKYTPSAREMVRCLISEYPWLSLIKNQGKKYDPILDYLITVGKEKESQDSSYESKYQSKVISEITGIKTSNIKKFLQEAYNDILELNLSNPELFCNGGKYLYRFSFSYLSYYYYSFFHLWLSAPLNLFESFDFPFIYAKVKCGYFWIEDIVHEQEYGRSLVTVTLKGGYPNLYRSLLLSKAQFTDEIPLDDIINLSEYQIEEKLKKYAKQQKL